MTANNTPTTQKGLGIPEAAALVGKQQQYIRILVIQGKIPARKVMIEGTNVPRWEIDREGLLKYFANGRKTARDDGRMKWALYATPDELNKVKAALERADLGKLAAMIERANDPAKAKAYRAKRSATKGETAEQLRAQLLAQAAKEAHPSQPAPQPAPSKEARLAAHAKQPA